MALRLTDTDDEFGLLAKSSAFDDALKEPDFWGRATKLFDLRENLWTAVGRTERNINDVTSTRMNKHSDLLICLGFGVGALAIFAGAVALLTPAAVLAGGVAAVLASVQGSGAVVIGAVAGVWAGVYGALTAGGLARIKPQRDGDKARDDMRAQNDRLQARIGREIGAMDKSLYFQDKDTQDKFRAAFKEAAFNQGLRDNSFYRPQRGIKAWLHATYSFPSSYSSSSSSSSSSSPSTEGTFHSNGSSFSSCDHSSQSSMCSN